MANIIVQDARQDFQNKMAGKQDTIITFAALMGRGDGERPDVDGREGYVWVRVGHAEALQMAYNSRVMPRDDLAIYVGYLPEQPNLLQVISVRQESYVNTNQGMIPVVKDHHLTHEWGGGDDVWIAYRRLVDLHLGQPAGFVVTLNPGLVYRNGAYMWIPQQTIDLSGSQPAVGAQARYVLVYLDALGVLSSRDGTIRPNPTALLVSDIPIPLAGEIAIAAVRLYASQTAIGDDPDNRDIVELREFQPYSAAGVHELLSATHDDTTVAACVLGDIITGQAGPAWARLAISVPAANVRNVLGVDNAETGPSWKTALDGNNPTTIGIGDAAAPGTSLIFSHRDHQHASPATWTPSAHALLSAIHTDTTASVVARGDLVVGVNGPSWDNLAVGGAGQILNTDGTDVRWSGANLTWDLTRLTAQIADAGTDTLVYPIRSSHITSGTAAADFGTGIEFYLEDAGGTAQFAGSLGARWTTATAGAEVSRLIGYTNWIAAAHLVLSITDAAEPCIDGNARGLGSVEIQAARDGVTQVASGDFATILGGYRNTADGGGSVVVGGAVNIASGAAFSYSTIIGGDENSVTGSRSVIVGGSSNSVTGSLSATIAGLEADIQGDYSVGLGRKPHIAAAHGGSFIFADNEDADFSSVQADEAAFRVSWIRNAYDNSYYSTWATASDGDVTFDITHAAGTPTFTFTHTVIMSTLTASTVIYSDASKQIVSLANAAGVLTNNGAGVLSWGAAAAHNLLSATHTDTAAQAVTRGSLIYGDSTPVWNELVIGGASGSVLTRDANDVLWSAYYLSGSAAQTYTFPAAGGTVAMLNAANVFTDSNTIASGKYLTCLTDGNTGGLRAGSGSDVLWYRGAANTWQTPDAVTIDGLLTVNADIKFPAAQVASADVNTLDDYEEGTFDVTLTASTSGTITLNAAQKTLAYTKVGRKVTVTGGIAVSAINAPVGNLVLNGLPFAVIGGWPGAAAGSVWGYNLAATCITAMVGYVSGSAFNIFRWATGGIGQMAGDVTATTVLFFGFEYFTT